MRYIPAFCQRGYCSRCICSHLRQDFCCHIVHVAEVAIEPFHEMSNPYTPFAARCP